MNLNLIEKFILIALSDEEGKFVTDTTYLNNGIAGAILLELALGKRIEIIDRKISLLDGSALENPFLHQTIQAIQHSDEKESLAFWMGALNANAPQVKEAILDDLSHKGVLKKVKGKFLWLFSYFRYPTKNPLPEDKVRAHIHEVIDQKVEPVEKDLMLLNLIDVCCLNHEAFRKPEDRQKFKALLIEKGNAAGTVHKAVIHATLKATVSATTA